MRKTCRLCGGPITEDPVLLNGTCEACGAIEPAYAGWASNNDALDRKLRERPRPTQPEEL